MYCSEGQIHTCFATVIHYTLDGAEGNTYKLQNLYEILDMRLQINLRPFVVTNWSPSSQLKKTENGKFDGHNFSRSAVFDCQAIEDGCCLSRDVATLLIKIYASAPSAWILDLVGQG